MLTKHNAARYLFTPLGESGKIMHANINQYIEVITIEEIQALAHKIVELAEDKQATDIIMLDLKELNTIADYFVICSGESDRQLKAILQAIDEGVGNEFGLEARTEGTADTGWVLLDYGDVVVHIFSVALRDFYRLERLWSKATPVVVVQ